ncbi:hypothetical protein [Acinetobacter baumannii]|uniref:hypothetical protein n=1 Tax=Acinetobacter baumannii TaxID=470 RepID=UPI00145B83A9|nr:hypothetical protein [Acinetobacter baumannii]MCA4181648.1 DUF551 domain-containing protein [Acinetobacter baumannii]MCZ3018381.1 DUF551 domain-containing protein [Acinetobacter baumannii]QJF29865.1 DUF551 domain-containing protein [Acinetobacter baumannii]QJF30329.1 DUF551 domain-containing protein [Acinetobacter baumannii]QJF31678.1 DUF551 domain-containing protein [Acinetobacter baumannii]
MTDLNKERELYMAAKARIEKEEFFCRDWDLWKACAELKQAEINELRAELEKAKAQAVPTWISVDDEWPPTDIMVLICWADAPDVTPEQDYMTIDEDLNSVWANYQNDPPSHWMHFHSVPNVSGAEQ